MIRSFLLLFFGVVAMVANAQVITLDGGFDDWKGITSVSDDNADGGDLDLLECAMSHDEEFFFIRVKTKQEFGMINPGYTNSQLHIYIDADFDDKTGTKEENQGIELSIFCGDKDIAFNYSGTGEGNGSLYDIGFLSLPTVTNTEFEIAIQRESKPDGQNKLVLHDSIRLFLYTTEGDFLPARGSSMKYVFEDNNPPAYEAITLERIEFSSSIRVMSYNVERGGLIDTRRQASLERIIKAAGPDIIGFSETQGSAAQIKDLLDDWLPNKGGWYTDKQGSNVLASRFPITFSQPVWSGSLRSMGSIVDLPDTLYSRDMVVITSHPNCCSADEARQDQVDMIASFILDAKSQGGELTVLQNTPIVMVGDFNLVGWQAQLNTLLYGDIQDEAIYGKGGRLDWDGSVMESASCLHTELPVAYTWRKSSSSFSPGKLDYIFFSGSSIAELKSFTLDTERMPQSKLTRLGLQANDALNASDHLPLVADLLPYWVTTSVETPQSSNIKVYPNPSHGYAFIESNSTGLYHCYNVHGKLMASGKLLKGEKTQLDLSNWAPGLYKVVLTENGAQTTLVVE